MAGEFYLSNIAGEFDYQQVLDVYYRAKTVPIQQLKMQEQLLDSKIQAFNSFKSVLSKVKDAFEKIDVDKIGYKTASVSDSSIASVSVEDQDKAIPGTYEIEVNRLAKNDIWLSLEGVSDLEASVTNSSGTLKISYAGEEVATINYDSSTSLKDLIDKINEVQDKVRASYVFDGSKFRLFLSGADTGSENTISLEETGGGSILDDLQIGSDYSDSHVQTAEDAQIEIYGNVISSPNNTFTNAIPGVSITANSVGTVSVTISESNNSFISSLKGFLSSYNSLVDNVKKLTAKGAPLAGYYELNVIRNSILSRLQPLFNLGILDIDDKTGHISLREEDIESLLKNDPDKVKQAVVSFKENLSNYLEFLDDPLGPINSTIRSFQNRERDIEERIEFMTKLINDQMEALKKELVQVQLLQEKMNQIQQRIKTTFNLISLQSKEGE